MDIKGADDEEDEGDNRSPVNQAEEDEEDEDDDDDDDLVVRLDGDDLCVSADETIIVQIVLSWNGNGRRCTVRAVQT